MIEVVRCAPDTRVYLIDGSVVPVGNSPEEIVDMTAMRSASLTRRAWSYIHVKYALENGYRPQDLLQERDERVNEVIKNVLNPDPQPSGLRRLARIYGDLFRPLLAPFKMFGRSRLP